jgi:hypothetical protein
MTTVYARHAAPGVAASQVPFSASLNSLRSNTMQMKPVMLVLGLAISAAPLSAQISRRDPSTRRPTQSGTIGDIIFGSSRADTSYANCRVRDAVTPDGRVVQVCDERRARRGDDDRDGDESFEHRRDGRGRQAHVNDRDGDGDFDARDRQIRKAEKDRQKALKKQGKAQRRGDD